jgi:hypothetical protein
MVLLPDSPRAAIAGVIGAMEAAVPSLIGAARSAARGEVRGLGAIFVAALPLQLTFQTFTTWYALHGTERFNIRPEDVTIGFIAWAVGGSLAAIGRCSW